MTINAYKAILNNEEDSTLGCFSEKEKDIKEKYLDTSLITNLNVFLNQKEVYIYIESADKIITPEELFFDCLSLFIPWPDLDGRVFRPMTEIYHYNEPQSASHWKRKTNPDYCFAKIAKIIPELTSRYIFYHYQLQEEKPGFGDKYGRIYLSGDIAFYYGEYPYISEPPMHKGRLSTNNSPSGEEWQSIMEKHFIMWDGYPSIDIKKYDWYENGYPEGKLDNQWLFIKNILSLCK
ncbi:MAG: hypothetical protein IKU15_04315 [Clostridia bacterium]|nr:hypothetical protein [Clostridia bacterium]